jgi:hypothetical protein
MQSLKEIAKQDGFVSFPLSLKQVFQKYNVHTALDYIAAHKIGDVYRQCCGSASTLGSPRGAIARRPDGSYFQNFGLGVMDLKTTSADPVVIKQHQATVQLAAVKCFGTDDPSGTDEPFVIFSIVSVDPTQITTHAGAMTVRTEIVNDISGGQIFFDDGRMLTNAPIDVSGSGLHIGVAVYDHDLGDPDKISDTIAQAMEEAAKKAAQVFITAAAAADPKLNGPIGDFTDYSILGVKPFKFIADAITGLFGFGDDEVGTHTFQLTEDQLLDFAQDPKFRADVDGLPSQDSFNVPTPDDFEASLIRGGGSSGSYKVYLRVRVIERDIIKPPPKVLK